MKLLRDKRFSANPAYKGPKYDSMQITDNRLIHAMLVKKMYEEVGEIDGAMNDVEEYADLLEAMYELAWRNGITADDIEKARREKRDDSGAFENGSLLYRGF